MTRPTWSPRRSQPRVGTSDLRASDTSQCPSIYVEPNRCDVRMSLVNTAFSGARPVGPDEAELMMRILRCGELRVPSLAVECPNNWCMK